MDSGNIATMDILWGNDVSITSLGSGLAVNIAQEEQEDE